MKRLIIVSGLSGAGKSVALHALEDAGFYCMDNIPLEVMKIITAPGNTLIPADENLAISMDVRSLLFVEPNSTIDCLNGIKKEYALEVVYITASPASIAQRYVETRRPHPLLFKHKNINDAIGEEIKCLLPLAQYANVTLNTTELNQHQLRYQIRSRFLQESHQLRVVLQSFGFKHIIPPESNYALDLRCLPNPYWEAPLQELSGKAPKVIEFLNQQEECNIMYKQLLSLIHEWIDLFIRTGKESLIISLGCTGGQHRSVYMVDRLYEALKNSPSCLVSQQHTRL